MTRTFLVVGLLWGNVALAQEVASGGQAWSVVSARTAGLNQNQLDASVGWPGVGVTYKRGLVDNFDLGAHFQLDYGQYGIVRYNLYAGMSLQAVAKVKFMDTGKVNLGLNFSPGMGFTFQYSTLVAFLLPVELRLGIVASSAVNVGVSFGFPMRIEFGGGRGFVFPILIGAGVEYFVRSDLALVFDMRMGPTIFASGTTAQFTFYGTFGVGWHF